MTPLFSRRFLSQAGLVAGAILFSAALQTQAAYTPPLKAPPESDVEKPLNTGITTQTKQGGINAANSTFTRIGTNGYSPISGYPTGWGGGIHTFDMFAEGTIGAGTSGVMKAGFNRDGNAWFNGKTTLQEVCLGNQCIKSWPQGQGDVQKGSAVYKCPAENGGRCNTESFMGSSLPTNSCYHSVYTTRSYCDKYVEFCFGRGCGCKISAPVNCTRVGYLLPK